MDVGAWLRGLGLERYEQVFRDNRIEADVLPKLTAEDLKDLGITLVGDRRRLLDAITALGAEVPMAPGDAALCPSLPTAATDGSPLPNPPPRAGEGRVGVEAERRQLTVMFCDLVGSTELAARLDPEDLREIIATYHRAVAEVVGSFDGFVAKYMGDGVLIYFGYPQAHEDDAERAVRAGLGVVDAVGRLDVKSVELQARIGIATGLVVVGDLIGEGSAKEQSVVGETPNPAARLQALAAPETVVIAAGTRRLIGDLFEYRDLGALDVRGIAEPVPAWRVLRRSAVASRFEALRGLVLTPLVGRHEEVELLLRRWVRAKAGDGQVVLVSGEPGIGKSRVTAALTERLRAEPHIRLRYFCSPYHQDSALYPFIDQIVRAAGFERDDPPVSRLQKLETLLAQAGPSEEDVALLADLLSLPALERYRLSNLSPQRKKEKTLEALIRQLDGLARQQPVVMVFEDAHWIDPTSRELLDLIVERVRTLRVLLIVTFRPEFQPPSTGQPQVTMLALNRLEGRDRTTLVEQIAGDKALPNDVIDQIADRTDGVPLFVEELTKSVLESGVTPLGIPTTLHDSLMARLDRLAVVRRVAQVGSAIGREFSYPLLQAVSCLPDAELQTALRRLVASELVFQHGTPPNAVYAFKHALVQEAAHGSLLRSSRQQLHAQIAEALEVHSPELMDTQPELLAQHYSEAGFVERSVRYWSKAGQRSTARSAMMEAAAQLQKGLDQLALLPDTPERQRQELEFRSALGGALFAAKGQGAAETGQAYARARELWEQLGSPAGFIGVPLGHSRYHLFRGELDLALRLEDDLLRLSRQRNDRAGLVLANNTSGRTLMFIGCFALSQSRLDQSLQLYDPILHQSLVEHLAVHVNVASLAYSAIVLFCLGYPDQALARSNTAIVEARRLRHTTSLAVSLALGARLVSFVEDDIALCERANQLIAVATEHGFLYWLAQGTIYSGWVKVKTGDVAEGISLLRDALSDFHSTGSQVWMPHHIAFLARARGIAGEVEEALVLLDDALDMVHRAGEHWIEAELNRHKGELLLGKGQTAAAEELYWNALSIAQEQEAKLWELRAAASLARLRRDQGHRAEARDLLAPVYGWFTEGFGTPDLKEAKALLDELPA